MGSPETPVTPQRRTGRIRTMMAGYTRFGRQSFRQPALTVPMAPTNQRLLITGGAGFIGSHLAEALVGSNEVVIFDDLSRGNRAAVPSGASFVQGDIRVGPLVEKHVVDADLVYHLASLVSVERSIANPMTCHSVIGDGTLNVLEAARDSGTRVILASSAAVYGHPETVPITETAPKRPPSPYGLEKLTVDRYARLYTDLYDLDTVVLRYFNVYGPGQPGGDYSGVITTFFEQARADEPITVHGDGTQTRDFIHVDDVVRANLAAAETEATGEAFNVGTGLGTSIRDLARTIHELVDSESNIVHTDPRPGDIEHSKADIEKAVDYLDYRAEIDIEDGLKTLRDHRQPPREPR